MKNEKLEIAEKMDQLYKELLETKDMADVYYEYASNKKRLMLKGDGEHKEELTQRYEEAKALYLETKDRKREIEHEIFDYVESLK